MSTGQTASKPITAGEAARALAEGRLVLMPTETVIALAADASIAKGLGALRDLLRRAGVEGGALTWHAPTRGRAIEVFAPRSPLHRRAFERLLPGPFRLLVECDADEAARIRHLLRVEPGVIDEAGVFGVRVPEHPFAGEVLGMSTGTVVAVRADAVGLAGGRTISDSDAAKAAGMGVVVALAGQAGITGYGSTTVRLTSDGRVHYVGGGMHDERQVRRRLERVLLLICTGNTCRSPMAAAIARHMLEQRNPAIPTRVESAGVAAGEGAPMTREAAEVLREMGVDPGTHRSRSLTRDLVREADVIYAMTRAHLDAVRALAPQAAEKVALLDPAGEDLPDPLGGPLEVYRETARKLRTLLEQRLSELDSQGDRA